jgi:RimJ/RimL family protein N-acetyltransferase
MTALITTLTSKRLTLRDKLPEDKESYLVTAGQAEAVWGFGGDANDIRQKNPKDADAWMNGRPGWMRWMITVKDGRRIGTVSLHDIEETDRRATLAIGISSAQDMNQGYGTEAMKLLIDHGFNSMKLHRIDLRVLARNKRAIRAYEKCGFTYEGTERESALIEGKWEDDVFMSVLEHEFEG